VAGIFVEGRLPLNYVDFRHPSVLTAGLWTVDIWCWQSLIDARATSKMIRARLTERKALPRSRNLRADFEFVICLDGSRVAATAAHQGLT
jgi:hypothetical protein